MNAKSHFIMIATLVLSLAWYFASFIPGEYDLFLFRDGFSQQIKWYVFDTVIMINPILLCLVILRETKRNQLKRICKAVIVYFSLCIVYYWCFWHVHKGISLWFIFSPTVIYCLYSLNPNFTGIRNAIWRT